MAQKESSKRAQFDRVRVFTGARCLARSIERALHFGVGCLLPGGADGGGTSEIAGVEGGRNGETGEGVREGKWDTHATASTGCPRTDIPCLNINDGRKWSRCFPRGENFAWQARSLVTADVNHP